MKQRILFMLLLLFNAALVMSQNQVIKGTVTDEEGKPVDAATINAKGTKRSVAANSLGAFTISAPSSVKTLVVSAIGFLPAEQTVSGSNLNIVLKKDEKRLNEVVVVGYGQTQKRAITGSISKVLARDVENQPVQSFESALQGKAPGVVVENSSGKVGEGIKVRIRGTSSISASSQPLYVVDGVPLTTASQSDINNEPTNPLIDLNPNDIESIEILKDAASSAIYGARAANGVVLITTKKGTRNNKSVIELNTTLGISNPTMKRGFLNAKEYVQAMHVAAKNDGRYDFANGNAGPDGNTPAANEKEDITNFINYYDTNFIAPYALGTDWRHGAVNTSWEDQQYRKNALSQQYDISVRGGNEKTRFFASGFYNDQEAIVIVNRFKRYGGRLNLEQSINDKLSIGINMSLARTELARVSNDDAFSTPGQLMAQVPTSPLVDPETHDINAKTLYANALFDAKYNSDNQVNYRSIGNIFGNYAFSPALSFRSEFGTDVLNMTEQTFADKRTQDGGGIGKGQYFTSQNVTFNTNNYFTYSPHFNDFKMTTLLGMSYLQNDLRQSNQQAENYPSAAVKNLTGATNVTFGNSANERYNFLSYFFRSNLSYKDKYLFGFSIRSDGSSRFGPENRYGYFPALSAGWLLSEEAFLKTSRVISNLKLRASWGLTGNAEIGEHQYLNLFRVSNYPDLAGFVPYQLGDPKLKWEKTTQTDIGLEFGLFNNRLSGEMDVYNKQTKDLLLAVNVPATNGYFDNVNFLNQILQNLGRLENKGLEIMLNGRIIDQKSFKWSSSFNIAFNKNKIKDIKGQVIQGSSLQRAIEGEPIGVFYMQKFLGVDPATGDALYLGEDGKPTHDYNAAKRLVVGDPNPRFTGGFTNNFSYKGFDLNVFFTFVSGNKIYNNAGRFMSDGFVNGLDNQTKEILNAWQKPGDITNVPRTGWFNGSGSRTSSRWLYDGSYIRLRQVSFGYNLPLAASRWMKISSARIFVSGTNLWTKTKYISDPEVNTLGTNISGVSNITGGVDFYTIPQPRTITFGLSVKF
ncbi:SusC/RagA family TonB-linked outer membrane protein [Segetibacter koreensis]|uniref:SusC/RagA family TonB-linked outer membrane protein n=1 Tax=Segetibacter koreensis TaxID=398037 RepID=UPI000364B190|nr:TonB-dependent receptor [Segetibacter koreensis]